MSETTAEWDLRYHAAVGRMMDEAEQSGIASIETIDTFIEEWVQRFVYGHPRSVPRDVIIEVHGIGSQGYLDICTSLKVSAGDYEEVTRIMNERYGHLLPSDLRFTAGLGPIYRLPCLRLEEAAQ